MTRPADPVDDSGAGSTSSRDWRWAVWAATAAFGAYFCMYAFRKPFTAASYNGTELWGLEFKSVLLISQVLGYMLSKMIGVKIVSEMPPRRRAVAMLGLILFAEAALVLFGLVPRPWNTLCLFLNGLPLGMVFGLVLGFLEGRRTTELLAAGLCASFILADGVAKSVGAGLLEWGVAEDWMPACAGALFLLPFAGFTAMLARLPPPNARDVAARSERPPMTAAQRGFLLRRYALGLGPLMAMYLAMTIVRSVRGDFAPEIWRDLGSPAASSTFTFSESLVALGVLAVNGAGVLIADNRRAFFVALATCLLGFALTAIALGAHRVEAISDFNFMVLIGLGLYLPYVAVHTTVFERLIAMTRERANIGFLMSVADSVGYLGYVGVMLARQFLPTTTNALELLTTVCWASIAVSTVCLLVSWRYFSPLRATQPSDAAT
ncbi:MAG TPA: DUF5690 family protein, partial [Pirellulales bacterium]